MTARRKRKAVVSIDLPPIPETVYSPLGDVPVIRLAPKDVPEKDKDDIAWWIERQRAIVVITGMPQTVEWAALFHEKVHMWLDDGNVTFPLDSDGENRLEERVCNIIGTALAAEMIAMLARKASE